MGRALWWGCYRGGKQWTNINGGEGGCPAPPPSSDGVIGGFGWGANAAPPPPVSTPWLDDVEALAGAGEEGAVKGEEGHDDLPLRRLAPVGERRQPPHGPEIRERRGVRVGGGGRRLEWTLEVDMCASKGRTPAAGRAPGGGGRGYTRSKARTGRSCTSPRVS